MNTQIVNHRQIGESAVEFHRRRRVVNRLLKLRQQNGLPLTAPREPGSKYMVSMHPRQGPHEVKQDGFIIKPHGVPEPHTFAVIHPGTLVVKRALHLPGLPKL